LLLQLKDSLTQNNYDVLVGVTTIEIVTTFEKTIFKSSFSKVSPETDLHAYQILSGGLKNHFFQLKVRWLTTGQGNSFDCQLFDVIDDLVDKRKIFAFTTNCHIAKLGQTQ
jgi:hypothetical protein